MTTSIGAGGIVSDDFSTGGAPGSESHWTEVDPVGDCDPVSVEGQSGSDARAVFTVPAGNHDTDTTAGNMEALQLRQSVTDVDWEIECKWDTAPDATLYKSMGLVCIYTTGEYVQLVAFENSGGDLSIHLDEDGSNQSAVDITTNPGAPFWLQLQRTGTTLYAAYSFTGVETFTTLGNFGLGTNVIDTVGVMAGNYTPAHTAKLDYFFENSARIDPEDPGPGGTRRVMVIS